MSWGQPTETPNPVSRRDPVHQPSVRLEQASPSPRLRTFQSSSSLYSELDKKERKGHKQALHSDAAEPDTTYCEGERAEEVLQDEEDDDLPVQDGLQVPLDRDALKRASATTTSSRGDPFHYDGERYSDFLRSSVERDVSDALHHSGKTAYSNYSVPQSPESHTPKGYPAGAHAGSFYNSAAIRSA